MVGFNQLMKPPPNPSLTTPSLTPANGLESYSSPTRRDSSISALGGLNPGAPSPLGALQDVNIRALGQSSWTPPVQPLPLLKAQPATLTIPKRKF